MGFEKWEKVWYEGGREKEAAESIQKVYVDGIMKTGLYRKKKRMHN
jgi:hypothetical protein